MIKKYNQFVNDRINEDVENFENDIDTNQQESELANHDLEEELNGFENEPSSEEEFTEEEEMEQEGGDVYNLRLKEVADKLGSEVSNGKVEYNGQKIIFPSETEMYHVGNKKFKTSDEVVSYLENESGRLADEESDNMKLDATPRQMRGEESDRDMDEMDEDERYSTMRESKSYKNTRKFTRK
jgi:hypothetical protein